jgi:hypothetical protein
LKLANSLQHITTNSFQTTIFRFGLQPYLRVAATYMKRKTLQQDKKATLLYEDGIFEIEVIHNLLIPHNNKTILV